MKYSPGDIVFCKWPGPGKMDTLDSLNLTTWRGVVKYVQSETTVVVDWYYPEMASTSVTTGLLQPGDDFEMLVKIIAAREEACE